MNKQLLGLCTWSMSNDVAELSLLMTRLRLERVHLALGPALVPDVNKYLDSVKAAGWKFNATMVGFPQENYSSLDTIRLTGGIVPDEYWAQNRRIMLDGIELTARLGAKYLETHFGFLDMDNQAYAQKLLGRTREIADAAAGKGITILMETGQETAATLKAFLQALDHPAVGVNFDPANMILYGKGNPIEAVKMLKGWIRHVHIKDAIPAKEPGMWGTEVPWSKGAVNANLFLSTLNRIGFTGPMSIEREAGPTRKEDITAAVEMMRSFPE